MHQRLQTTRYEAVVDEKVFLNIERCVAMFEVTGAIVSDSMAKDQILSARGARIGSACTNPIRCNARLSVVGVEKLRATVNHRRSSAVISMPEYRSRFAGS